MHPATGTPRRGQCARFRLRLRQRLRRSESGRYRCADGHTEPPLRKRPRPTYATAPATPEPTPTPTATPFPPGPPSKLGVFIGYNHPQIFELLATGNVALVKTLEVDPNFVTEIKRLSPNTVLVAR